MHGDRGGVKVIIWGGSLKGDLFLLGGPFSIGGTDTFRHHVRSLFWSVSSTFFFGAVN